MGKVGVMAAYSNPLCVCVPVCVCVCVCSSVNYTYALNYTHTNNTHKRQTSMPLAGLEPAIPANDRPQTYATDLTASGIGLVDK